MSRDLLRRGRISLAAGLLAILREQLRRIRLNSRRALRRFAPEDLHDLRVALRRFRAGLRLVRRHWPQAWNEKLLLDLAAFSAAFGPLRDAQVRSEFLARSASQNRCRADTGWNDYRRACQRQSRQAAQELRRLLCSSAWRAALTDMAQALQRHLPRLAAEDRAPFAAALTRRLARVYNRIRKQNPQRRMTSERFHDLRRLCRRGRYLAEFLLTFHRDRRIAVLRRQLQNICDALGDLHDADMHLRCLGASRDMPSLRRALREIRRRSLKRFARVWRKIQRPGARRRLRKALQNKTGW